MPSYDILQRRKYLNHFSHLGTPMKGMQLFQRIAYNTHPEHLIGYWPLSDPIQNTAYDISGNENHGTYNNVILNQPGVGDGRLAAEFDTTGYVSIYTADVASRFDGDEGSLLIYFRVTTAAWGDGVNRWAVVFSANATNRIGILKSSAAGGLGFVHRAGGVNSDRFFSGYTNTDFMCLAWTWSVSNNRVRCYEDGTLLSQAGCGGAFAGPIIAGETLIGAVSTVPASPFDGFLAHVAVWEGVELTQAEIQKMCVI